MGKSPSHKSKNIPKPAWAKEQDEFHSKTKYPYCKGTFPDCPVEIKQEEVNSLCKVCPIYKK